MLAGVVQQPERINPVTSMTRAKSRQGYVLAQMVKHGMLGAREAEAATEGSGGARTASGPPGGAVLRGGDPPDAGRPVRRRGGPHQRDAGGHRDGPEAPVARRCGAPRRPRDARPAHGLPGGARRPGPEALRPAALARRAAAGRHRATQPGGSAGGGPLPARPAEAGPGRGGRGRRGTARDERRGRGRSVLRRGAGPCRAAHAPQGGPATRRLRHPGRRREEDGHRRLRRALGCPLLRHRRLGPAEGRGQVDPRPDEAVGRAEARPAGPGAHPLGSHRRQAGGGHPGPGARGAGGADGHRPGHPPRGRPGRRVRLRPLVLQPRHPGPPAARLGLQALPLRRGAAEPEVHPDLGAQRRARGGARPVDRQGVEAAELREERLRGPDDAATGVDQVQEHRVRPAHRGHHPAGGDRLRPAGGHPLRAAGQPDPGAGDRRGDRAGAGQRLHHLRRAGEVRRPDPPGPGDGRARDGPRGAPGGARGDHSPGGRLPRHLAHAERGGGGHGDGGARAEPAGRGQDGHRERVPRRVVQRLHAGPRRHRLGGLRRPREPRHRRDGRQGRAAHLARLHAGGAGGQAGARLRRFRPGCRACGWTRARGCSPGPTSRAGPRTSSRAPRPPPRPRRPERPARTVF